MIKFLKFFGVLYFLINLAVFATISVLAINSMGKYLYSPGWIYLVFPAMGMVSGYWMWTGKYSLSKKVVVAFSLFCSATLLVIIFVAIPQIKTLNTKQLEKAQTIQQNPPDKEIERLFLGVYTNDIAIITEQLAKGVNVNAKNETQQTVLHVTQSPEIAQRLIEYGADINAKDDLGAVPIFNKELPTAKILFTAGNDINIRNEKGNTLLLWWTYSGYLEGIKYLVEHGGDINACNIDRHNALDIAEHFQPNSDTLKYLQTLNIQPCSQ